MAMKKKGMGSHRGAPIKDMGSDRGAKAKADAARLTKTKGKRAESARMEKQAERGVGIDAKKSERNAVTKKADKVFGKGNYNLVSGARMKVPVSNRRTGKNSWDYIGDGELTAVAKGVGSISKANTRITAYEHSAPMPYNPFRKKTLTIVTRKKTNPLYKNK